MEAELRKTYRGHRGIGGCAVTVDGQPLPPRLDLANHSPTGFEWGYGGSGPAQLALAILCAHLCEQEGLLMRMKADGEALDLYQAFKWRVIAGLPAGEWTLTTADIDRALAEIRAEREAGAELRPEEVPF
jgi:Family of unknown function (DUF6166)